jgi:hypothetical protein
MSQIDRSSYKSDMGGKKLPDEGNARKWTSVERSSQTLIISKVLHAKHVIGILLDENLDGENNMAEI